MSIPFCMPAEWEPQEAIWLSWPHNQLTWPGDLLHEVERSYLQIIQALHKHQKVKLLVQNPDAEAKVRDVLRGAGVEIAQVVFFQISTQDAWIRDYGPTFVVNHAHHRLAMVKWIFNAWGNKYEDLLPDDNIPYEINRRFCPLLTIFQAGIVLEGGSIEVNGAGTLLTTEQCLLNKNRNPNLGRLEIEDTLKNYLRVKTVLWLKEGIVGDDTDGHIDDIARFVDADTVVCAFEEDPSDQNYEILKDNYERLLTMVPRVVKLPMPSYVSDSTGRLPASYANFYIGNGAVAVPTFGHANDSRALDILQKCFPNRHVVGVNCTAMVHGLGTIHCCSQQEPVV